LYGYIYDSSNDLVGSTSLTTSITDGAGNIYIGGILDAATHAHYLFVDRLLSAEEVTAILNYMDGA